MLNKNKVFLSAMRISCIALAVGAILFSLYLSLFAIRKIPALIYALYPIKIIFSLFVISSTLSDRAKCSWIFLAMLIPTAAIPTYLLFRYAGLSKKKRKFIKSLADKKPKKESFESKMLLKSKYNFTFLKEIANYSSAEVYRDTDADYFAEAKDMFSSLEKDLRKARRFIFMEFYILATGEAFGSLFDILKAKAKEGVEIRIIFDGLGSLTRLPENFSSIMSSLGIKTVSHPALSLSIPSSLNNRNHRKIVIIDGEIAYTGGVNLADEYIYSKVRLGRWKDSAVRLCGEGVNALTYTFLSDFAILTGVGEDFSKYYKYRKKRCDGQAILFSDGPSHLYREKSAKKIIISMLDAAEKYFIFTTPYLICDSDIFNAVRGAVMRGVKVRAVIPKKPDKYLVALLTRRYAARLVLSGAEVYLYTPGFLHSKSYLSDGKFLMLGTVNLDYRSLFHNFENGVLFAEHKIIEKAEKDINSIVADSEPYRIKRESIPLRLFCAVLEIFAPLL